MHVLKFKLGTGLLVANKKLKIIIINMNNLKKNSKIIKNSTPMCLGKLKKYMQPAPRLTQ